MDPGIGDNPVAQIQKIIQIVAAKIGSPDHDPARVRVAPAGVDSKKTGAIVGAQIEPPGELLGRPDLWLAVLADTGAKAGRVERWSNRAVLSATNRWCVMTKRR